jgi:hypothetical protein
VTPATIFRANLAGAMTGPWLSQFLWLPVPYGALPMAQKYTMAPREEYMTTYDAWLAVQNGQPNPAVPTGPARPPTVAYMTAGRDLATFLDYDFPYQAYLNAALILFDLGMPPDAATPTCTPRPRSARSLSGSTI